MRKRMWMIMLVPAAVILFFLWASYPWDLRPRTEVGLTGMVAISEDPPDNATTLTILSWNVAYAFGMGSEGTEEYQPKSQQSYHANLRSIGETIRASSADVVLLQEIDFGSARSGREDQLRILAEASGLAYWARAESWRTQYVPFPYWPIQRNFGGVSSGGAILSRWPISHNEIELLNKPSSQAWWYKLFYPYRYFQTATIQAGKRSIKVVNLHLEAFDVDNKAQQAQRLLHKVSSEKPDFVGGDFNMLPVGAVKRRGFANPADIYDNDRTAQLLVAMPMKEVVENAAYLQREESWFTFPSSRPDRRLDYLFFKDGWILIAAEVFLPKDRSVSDHLPLKAVFNFNAPTFIKD